MSGERVEGSVFILQEVAINGWRDVYFYLVERDAIDGYEAACQEARRVRVLKRTTIAEVVRG